VDNNRVVIVGAGPSGLVAGCELMRLGVPVRVLDTAGGPASGSRAIILWPPTLEVFAELGVLAEAEKLGVRPRALAYHMGNGRLLRLPLDSRNAPLLLSQQETGRLLDDALARLNGRVEYSVRVTDVRAGSESVALDVTGPAGQDTIEAEWLIGADGVGSTVRQRLGIEFPGDLVPATFVLAEGPLSGDFSRDEVHYFLGSKGVMLLAPLPGGMVRMSAPIKPDMTLDADAVQRLMDERGPGGLRFASLSTLGTFTSQERIAATMRQGRVFLVGDAAHVHSVVGGQGLNLGLQDGRNLAWKLAGVIQGRFAPAVLDSYSPERRAAAEQVVRATGRMARQAVAGPVASRVRDTAWALMRVTGVLDRVYTPMLAGWRTRYPDVLFGAPDQPGSGQNGRGKAARGRPRPGTRAAGSLTAGPAEAMSLLRLLTSGSDAGLERAAQSLAEQFANALTHERSTSRQSGFVLLRPDGFVAASGSRASELAGLGARLAGLAAARPTGTPPGASHPAAMTLREE